MQYQQSEATAARRRVPLHLVDATDGITPETGEAGGQSQISKNGAAFANTSATLTAIGDGAYYVELTAAELDTLGFFIVRFKSAATAEFQIMCQVVAYDPYAAALAANVTFWQGVPVTIGANGPDVQVAGMDNNTITANAIAANAIGSSELATDAIGSDQIAANAIGSSELANGAIGTAQFQTNAIDASVLADNTITNAKIATDAIGSDEFADSAVDKILDETYEGTTTLRQFLRLAASALFGKAAGMNTTTGTFRDEADTKDRITATIDANGNRSAVTLDKT